jgi:DNA-binding NarL/FixJ family response regulator
MNGLAKMHQMARAECARARRAWGEDVEPHRGGAGNAVYSTERLVEMLGTGMSQAQAARELGVSQASVSIRIKKLRKGGGRLVVGRFSGGSVSGGKS